MLGQIFSNLRADRAAKEEIYEMVAAEIRNGAVRDGLWVKALAQSNGNEGLAKSVYVELRFKSLKDEIITASEKGKHEPVRSKELALASGLGGSRAATAIGKLQASGFQVRNDGKAWIVTSKNGAESMFREVSALEGAAALAEQIGL